MELLTPGAWPDYELIDCGNFEKLERFGEFITHRPEPQAIWSPVLSEGEWKSMAHVRFIQKTSNSGEWKKNKKMPDQWQMRYALPQATPIVFRLGLTAFKHVGIFPEQAPNWDYIVEAIRQMGLKQPKVLNLFAYTGGATLAAKAAGADITHLDAIKQVVTWAGENVKLSGLDNVRWIIDDALKFAQREVRRGNKYHGIILDPPAFGHGPKGEKWKLEDSMNEMVRNVLSLLDPDKHFLILNAYSLGLSSLVIENLLKDFAGKRLHTGELYLQSRTGMRLPLGVFGRFTKS